MSKNERKKIIFVMPSLGGGGAERVCLNILKYINRERFITSVVLFEKKGVYLNQIPEDVAVYDLNKRNRFDFLKLIFKLTYRIYPIVKPDIVVSFLNYANFINILSKVVSFFVKPSIVISERNYTSISLKFRRLKRIKTVLVKNIYPWADKIIVISKGIKKDLIQNFKIPIKKIKVIYNAINFSEIEKLSRESVAIKLFTDDIPVIVACGRLTYQKNFSLLLNAFSKVIKKHNAKLLILGEGEEKDKLIKLSHKLKIDDKVFFLGFQKNPFKYMAKADVFILSSLYEGFGNVLVEAMACGTPIVSTCCPSGPPEIITDEVNGLLVPVGDVDAMAKAIFRLLKDETLRKHLVEAGKNRAKDFRVEKMVAEYENVFENIFTK